ncbi:MAG: CPBP family glutamic-type intramembrane protease [Candidatus Angelobacter sp.]
MNRELPDLPGFWRTLGWLLRAARKRSEGRQKRQRQLLQHRSGTDWGVLGFAFGVLVMAGLNICAAFVLRSAVTSGQRVAAENQGKIVVSSSFLASAKAMKSAYDDLDHIPDHPYSDLDYSSEARQIEREYGGKADEIEQKLRDAVRDHGVRDLISNDEAAPGLAASTSPLPAMLGSLILIWWGVVLVFQREGVELDLQRRRHPMWEWLFSHPVPAGAVFLAEMLSPIAANPIYWGAPLFVGVVYGFVYDPRVAMLAILLIGVPITVAAACLGKALEIGVVLRFSPRSRGAMVGLMGWLGYASMMLFFLGLFIVPKIVNAVGRYLGIFTVLPWPWLKFFLGAQTDGSFSFLAGMAACWIGAAVTTGAAVWFSVWGAQQGLSGNVGQADSRPKAKKTGTSFGKEPLYRKELLWFTRDRSAVVQAILIPMTVASFQLFNFRGLLNDVQGAWNYLSGAAILFGTYFLWVLGPKSLASEGSALWIALTWPRGLESLLKAKAWLWSLISSCVVALVLCYAAYLFPASIWKIALVGVGWFFFGRSMAEKSVTLVTVTSQSGEPEKIPAGRRWAAQLGMLTFSIGVLMQQWHLAVIGIVYSYITAAAMWQNFRARLPYLYDPWSERLPPPPTLMHAMIAISILVDAGAVLTGMVSVATGPEGIAVAQAISYGICAIGVSLGMTSFLGNRGVSLRDVLDWPTTVTARGKWESWWQDQSEYRKLPWSLLLGAAAGLVLGLFAYEYVGILQHFPALAELIRKSREQLANMPGARISYAVMAVGFAPFAEEYLFRGLLFRALDREWGGWRAVVGSAAFFAVYHSPLSWLPVALLGAANALIFKKTGRLAPAIVLHMVYNAVVLTWT